MKKNLVLALLAGIVTASPAYAETKVAVGPISAYDRNTNTVTIQDKGTFTFHPEALRGIVQLGRTATVAYDDQKSGADQVQVIVIHEAE